jgi:RNA polymerase sigma factor (sigma-70 family)
MDSQQRRGGAERDAPRRSIPAMIAAARAGAEEAYQEFLAAYGPRLYGYFYRAIGSHHEAEDLLGEMMLRLVRGLPAYNDRGRFEPWLFSIAANLVRDRIRRARASPAAASLEAETDGGATLAETLGADQEAVEAPLIRREDGAAVVEALEKIDERSRQMVLLRHFGQLSFREIAEIFDCPIGTVLARVHRALKGLRAVLEERDESD